MAWQRGRHRRLRPRWRLCRPGVRLLRHAIPVINNRADGPCEVFTMIRKLKSGQYRLYSRKVDPRTGRRRNLGTFSSRAAAERHERAVQFFKRQH